MTRRMSSRRVALTTASFVLALTGMSACDAGNEDTEDGHFYCTDDQGTVVAEHLCDDPDGGGGGFFFMYMGSSMHAPPVGHSSYPVGSKMPAGIPKFQNTVGNRTKLGLPSTGRVSNGTVKTGVVGKGGAGSSIKGGGSGGAKGGSGGG